MGGISAESSAEDLGEERVCSSEDVLVVEATEDAVDAETAAPEDTFPIKGRISAVDAILAGADFWLVPIL